jgi:hypothetical protein
MQHDRPPSPILESADGFFSLGRFTWNRKAGTHPDNLPSEVLSSTHRFHAVEQMELHEFDTMG